MGQKALSFLIGVLFCIVFVSHCHVVRNLNSIMLSSDVSVSLNVEPTSIRINGKSSPGSFVSVTDSGDTVGTATTASDGSFSIILSGISPTIHILTISARDLAGATTASTTSSISAAADRQTVLPIFLASTLSLVHTSVIAGQVDLASGLTYPGSLVYLHFSSGLVATAPADLTGYWQLDIASLKLSPGQQKLFVVTAAPSGELSTPSTVIDLTVLPAYSSFPATQINRPRVATLTTCPLNANVCPSLANRPLPHHHYAVVRPQIHHNHVFGSILFIILAGCLLIALIIGLAKIHKRHRRV